MKKINIFSTTILIVAMAIYALGILLTGLGTTMENAAFLTLVEANSILFASAIVGVFLMFAKNDSVRKLGNGLTVVGVFCAAVCAMGLISSLTSVDSDEISLPIGAILIIVAAILLLVYYALLFIDYLLNKTNGGVDPNEDKRIALLKEWKQLKEDGFITEEQFEEKRLQILGLKNKTK